MMRSDTQSVTIDARPEDVLAFVADGANMPRWAIGFAKAVRAHDDGWIVTTATGDVVTRIAVHDAVGTVDFQMAMGPDLEKAAAYARVLPNGKGSEFMFTQFQQPGMPTAVFDQLVAAVGHELVTLKALLEIECPL